MHADSECIYHSVEKEAQICCGQIFSRIFVVQLLLQLIFRFSQNLKIKHGKKLPFKTMLTIDHNKEKINIQGHGSVKSNMLSLLQ